MMTFYPGGTPENRKKFLEKLSRQIVYLHNPFEECVMRVGLGQGLYVKFKGKAEWKHVGPQVPEYYMDCMSTEHEITKEEYDKF